MSYQNQKPYEDPAKRFGNGHAEQNKKTAGTGDALFWGVIAVLLILGRVVPAVVLGIMKISGNEWLQRVLDKLNGKQPSADTARRSGTAAVRMQKTADKEYTVVAEVDPKEIIEEPAKAPSAESAAQQKKQAVAYPDVPVRDTSAGNGSGQGTPSQDPAAKGAFSQSKKNARKDPLKKAKFLQVLGIILAVCGVILAGSEIGDALSMGWYGYMLKSLLDAACLLGGGALLHSGGAAIKKREQRFKQYLAAINGRKLVDIGDLVKISGGTNRRVYADLEKMMESGLLPASAYIDRGRNCLVLDPAALEQQRREETAKQQADAIRNAMHGQGDTLTASQPESELSEYEKTLREIRGLNDDIADDVMSAKIDKIENVTRAIFALLEKNPERRQEVRSFFGYYLPTTLKLLRFYAQLEDQPVQGTTILESRRNIENIMDTLIKGFEAQLDSLFRTEALDISSDIRVLETMLAQDGIGDEGQDAIVRTARATPQRAHSAGGEAVASMPEKF